MMGLFRLGMILCTVTIDYSYLELFLVYYLCVYSRVCHIAEPKYLVYYFTTDLVPWCTSVYQYMVPAILVS